MRMITVVIQGKEVRADLLNPEVAKKVEDGFDATLERFNKANDSGISGSEGIRMQCEAVIDYVKDIFGEKAAKEIFGTQTDLLTCLDVIGEISRMYPEQVNPKIREKTDELKEMIS